VEEESVTGGRELSNELEILKYVKSNAVSIQGNKVALKSEVTLTGSDFEGLRKASPHQSILRG
jgi:hypothetical protein